MRTNDEVTVLSGYVNVSLQKVTIVCPYDCIVDIDYTVHVY